MGEKIVDFSVLEFANYNEYLDSYITTKDRRYLGNRAITNYIVKLGYRSTKAPYKENEFEKRRELALLAIRPKIMGIQYYGDYLDPENKDPVLLEFRKREKPNLTKVLTSIVFTTFHRNDGSEISGYLDLDMSWRNAMREAVKHTDWRGVFEGRVRLKPMPHHLSYSNPHYNILKYTPSDNFSVLHDHDYGLLFMHKGDHKIISVGNQITKYSKNASRTMVYSPKLGYVIFYDHIVRKKV
ncbi:cilia- and flagella-associated protein 299 [Scaptodrosophila lebanonensis]|uniref:Cilia- and flagella-associated protein 299 n=1 Tax=Drosophila lebanonensis TaxID=7225 RepID=A0A6J2TZN5_DROLE|nr:cilia- and flagella-associated protein 299 [Scaptodrosophila lebanonensis]